MTEKNCVAYCRYGTEFFDGVVGADKDAVCARCHVLHGRGLRSPAHEYFSVYRRTHA